MNVRQSVKLSVGLALGGFLAGAGAAPLLPEVMAIHWNAGGAVDGTMRKWFALALLPAVTVALVGLLHALPRVDPRRENYRPFRPRYNEFVVLLAGFLTLVHLVVVTENAGVDVPTNAVVFAAMGGLFYYLGRLLEDAEPNWFVGIRTPWTLSDDAVWEETHRLAARLFRLSGVLAVLGAFTGRYGVVLAVGPAVASAVAATLYSYWLYAQGDGDFPGTSEG